MEFIGMLKVKVLKGTNLAIRDMLSSDPYVVLALGHQVSLVSDFVQNLHGMKGPYYIPVNLAICSVPVLDL